MEQLIENLKKSVDGYNSIPADGSKVKATRRIALALTECRTFIKENEDKEDRGQDQRFVREVSDVLAPLPMFRALLADRQNVTKMHTRKQAEDYLGEIQTELEKSIKDFEDNRVKIIQDWVKFHPILKGLKRVAGRRLPKDAYVLLFEEKEADNPQLITRATREGKVLTRFHPREFSDESRLYRTYHGKPPLVGAAVIAKNELIQIIGKVPEATAGKEQLHALTSISKKAVGQPGREFIDSNTVLRHIHSLCRKRKIEREDFILLFESADIHQGKSTSAIEPVDAEAVEIPVRNEGGSAANLTPGRGKEKHRDDRNQKTGDANSESQAAPGGENGDGNSGSESKHQAVDSDLHKAAGEGSDLVGSGGVRSAEQGLESSDNVTAVGDARRYVDESSSQANDESDDTSEVSNSGESTELDNSSNVGVGNAGESGEAGAVGELVNADESDDVGDSDDVDESEDDDDSDDANEFVDSEGAEEISAEDGDTDEDDDSDEDDDDDSGETSIDQPNSDDESESGELGKLELEEGDSAGVAAEHEGSEGSEGSEGDPGAAQSPAQGAAQSAAKSSNKEKSLSKPKKIRLIVRKGDDGRVITRFRFFDLSDSRKLFEFFKGHPPVVGAAVVRGRELKHSFGMLPVRRGGQSQLDALLEQSRKAMEQPAMLFVNENEVLKQLQELLGSGANPNHEVVLFAMGKGRPEPLQLSDGRGNTSSQIPLSEFRNPKFIFDRLYNQQPVIGASVIGEQAAHQGKKDEYGSRVRGDNRGGGPGGGAGGKPGGHRGGPDARGASRGTPVVFHAFGQTPLKQNILLNPETLKRLGIDIVMPAPPSFDRDRDRDRGGDRNRR